MIKQFAGDKKLESRIHFKKPKKERKERTEKPASTSTAQVSLNMFNDGMSIEDIAEQRHLAITTIETHLAAFVKSGDLEVTRLVPKQKLTKILDTIRASGQASALKPIKDLMGDDYTYGEIRMALEYYKRLSSN